MAFKNNSRKKKSDGTRRPGFSSRNTETGKNQPPHRSGPFQTEKKAQPSPVPVSKASPHCPGEAVPESYDRTFMCALPRDPETIFTYWEIAGPVIRALRETIGEDAFKQSKWVLRVHDVTHIFFDGANAWRSDTLHIDGSANEWYVPVPESGRTYMLECGLQTPDSVFFCLATSNTCAVPRRGVRAHGGETCDTVRTEEIIRMSLDAMSGGAARPEDGFYVYLGDGSGSGSMQ